MSALSELKNQIASLVEGGSIDAFQEWFVPAVMNGVADSELDALSAEVELRLAEHTSGHLSEPELREEFRALLEGRLVASGQPAPKITYRITTTSAANYEISVGTSPLPLTQELELRTG
ncbi:MAG: hypothetical protein E6K79_09405 [Candidatus Eisenbacteria bacterium]|uniref:Uncharacterized protein n=1 Tax=Eiseniibacteriota bacterium TaxID=2212470 RepID=A0A538TJQ4_UNCEI|nr:MAG: hypothetical protein E6K79_09405 [Candidatus Eisenbacteria bacterium]